MSIVKHKGRVVGFTVPWNSNIRYYNETLCRRAERLAEHRRLSTAEKFERAEVAGIIAFYVCAVIMVLSVFSVIPSWMTSVPIIGMCVTGLLIIVFTVLQAHYEANDLTEDEDEIVHFGDDDLLPLCGGGGDAPDGFTTIVFHDTATITCKACKEKMPR